MRTIPPREGYQKANKRKNAAMEITLQRRQLIGILMKMYGKRLVFPLINHFG